MRCEKCRFGKKNIGTSHYRCTRIGTAPLEVNLHGVVNGWFFFPIDFDPIWANDCSGFLPKERGIKGQDAYVWCIIENKRLSLKSGEFLCGTQNDIKSIKDYIKKHGGDENTFASNEQVKMGLKCLGGLEKELTVTTFFDI